ncbi:aldehyde dehydrogenase family protein [Nocardioides sp. SYSU DS0651]|uniref:aldehyde dehydrogenase family protein n=1 Tax=Nocardioides sp. SYSU DS0651 TaxID=3415955 RepID=UPI003F4C78D8
MTRSTDLVPPRYQALVGGEWTGAAEDDWLDVRDPAAWDTVIAQVPSLSADTVRGAYKSAREGAEEWAATGALTRSTVLFRAAALLRERAPELTALLTRENGKTTAEATVEVAKSAEFFEFYAGLARLPYGELIHDARERTTTSVRREPVGVVLVITPWNDPLLTPARKLAPALFAGNAVVLKPASDTPVIALELVRALVDAGVPARAVTAVTGRAGRIADALIESDEIDAVTFTGSTDVGLDLQRSLAGRNLRVQTEMGGKNASIVLADADLDLAADTIAAAGFAQAGQRCTATSRVLVEASVHDALLERLVARAGVLVPGAGSAEGTTLCPVINPGHRREIDDHVARAETEGARVLAGAVDIAGLPQDGCFVRPTVVADVTPDMSIWTQEVFGPVVAVMPVAGLEQAIELTNASEYGLSAALFTRDIGSSEVFLDRVRTGQAAVNLPTSGWDVHHPFGGYKLSGSAHKEQGLEALHFYQRVKTCAVRAV